MTYRRIDPEAITDIHFCYDTLNRVADEALKTVCRFETEQSGACQMRGGLRGIACDIRLAMGRISIEGNRVWGAEHLNDLRKTRRAIAGMIQNGDDAEPDLWDYVNKLSVAICAFLAKAMQDSHEPSKGELMAAELSYDDKQANKDPYFPSDHYKQFNLSPETLRRAAHVKRIASRKGNGNRNHYRDADVRRIWPNLFIDKPSQA